MSLAPEISISTIEVAAAVDKLYFQLVDLAPVKPTYKVVDCPLKLTANGHWGMSALFADRLGAESWTCPFCGLPEEQT